MSTAPALRSGIRPRRALLRRSAVALTAASALLGTAAAAAQAAGPYGEVVTRAWGVDGASPTVPFGSPGAVSSDGKWSAFTGNATIKQGSWDGFQVAPPDYYLYVRDIMNNRTYQVTSKGWAWASSFDDAGRYLTYTTLKNPGTTNEGNGDSQLWVVDTTRNVSTLVGRATGANGATAAYASGQVSGDGKSVVFTSSNVPGSGPGIYRRTIATNVTTRLGDLPTGPEPYEDGPPQSPQSVSSISKSGSVATFTEYLQNVPGIHGLIVSPAGRVEVLGKPVVSGDGSTVAYIKNTGVDGDAQRLVFRSVTTGAETSYTVPQGDGDVVWVSADGKQAAIAPNAPFTLGGPTPAPPYHAQLFDRASGSWSPAGPFANAFYTPTFSPANLFSTTVFSRNGRFTLFGAKNSTLVVDNYGAALPGGGSDHPPANTYFTAPTSRCPGDTSTELSVTLTPDYIEPVKSLVGTVTIDGKYAGQDTFTTDRSTTIPMAADAKTLTIKATVTFLNGQTATGTYDYAPHGSPFCS